MIEALRGSDLAVAAAGFSNALEAPAFAKFPVLALYQEFLRSRGAAGALMSGSGSTTFALVRSRPEGETLMEAFRGRFGSDLWMDLLEL